MAHTFLTWYEILKCVEVRMTEIFAQKRKNFAGFALILGVFSLFPRNFDEKTRVLQQLKFFSLKTSVKNWLQENARTVFSGGICFSAHQWSENYDKHPPAFQASI